MITRILGIDPGLNRTGWGVIEIEGNRLRHIAHGVVTSDAVDALSVRLSILYAELAKIIALWQPDEAAVEEVFVNRNPASTLKLGMARGIALLAPAMAGKPVAEYAANLVKKSVVGAGHADKAQVAMMVGRILPGTNTKADAADALAVAICHAHHRNAPGLLPPLPTPSPQRGEGRGEGASPKGVSKNIALATPPSPDGFAATLSPVGRGKNLAPSPLRGEGRGEGAYQQGNSLNTALAPPPSPDGFAATLSPVGRGKNLAPSPLRGEGRGEGAYQQGNSLNTALAPPPSPDGFAATLSPVGRGKNLAPSPLRGEGRGERAYQHGNFPNTALAPPPSPGGFAATLSPEGRGNERVYLPKPSLTQITRARRLRTNSTDVEAVLWRRLRNGQLGAKFRRQAPILNYVADFLSHDARLIVELDGGQHADSEADERRTKFLEQAGFQVLRFWNNEVNENLEGVLVTIASALSSSFSKAAP